MYFLNAFHLQLNLTFIHFHKMHLIFLEYLFNIFNSELLYKAIFIVMHHDVFYNNFFKAKPNNKRIGKEVLGIQHTQKIIKIYKSTAANSNSAILDLIFFLLLLFLLLEMCNLFNLQKNPRKHKSYIKPLTCSSNNQNASFAINHNNNNITFFFAKHQNKL